MDRFNKLFVMFIMCISFAAIGCSEDDDRPKSTTYEVGMLGQEERTEAQAAITGANRALDRTLMLAEEAEMKFDEGEGEGCPFSESIDSFKGQHDACNFRIDSRFFLFNAVDPKECRGDLESELGFLIADMESYDKALMKDGIEDDPCDMVRAELYHEGDGEPDGTSYKERLKVITDLQDKHEPEKR